MDIQTVEVNMRAGEHKSAQYRTIHPFGQVPALEDDGLKMFESGAILCYMYDKAGKLDTPQKRALANQWTLFANRCVVGRDVCWADPLEVG